MRGHDSRGKRRIWSALSIAAVLTVGILLLIQPKRPVEQSEWNASIAYARRSANAVQTYYPSPRRDTFVLRNAQMEMEHGLTVRQHKQATSFRARGKEEPLLADTMDAVIVDGQGIRYRASLSADDGRINIFRMGLYYTEVHLFDLTMQPEQDPTGAKLPVKVEKIFHLYPDRMFQEIVWHFAGDAVIREAYLETSFAEASINGIRIADDGGTSERIDRADEDSVHYIGFSIIGKKGTFGYVYPQMKGNGTVRITGEDGRLAVRHFADVGSGSFAAGSTVKLGSRIYVSAENDWGDLEREAERERHPLGEASFKVSGEKTGFEGYRPLQGYYAFTVDHSDFNTAFYKDPHKHPSVVVDMHNDGLPRNVYIQVRTREPSGSLEGAALLDENGVLLPIPVEVAKNFQGEQEEAFYYPGDRAFSESYFPLALKPGQRIRYTALHAYQNWGAYPLKQISSVRFTNPYYHLSTGVTETNCWVPFYVNGRRDGGWILPDFRTRSGDRWATQPQYDSVGKNYFFTYNEPDGKWVVAENRKVTLDSVGLTHSDLTLDFVTDDGKANVSIRSVELPQTDENRTYVSMDITFNDTLDIRDPARNLSFFRSEGRNQTFSKLGWIGTDNRPSMRSMLETERFVEPLGDDKPFWTMFDFSEDGTPVKGTNVGLLLLESHIVIGGKAVQGGLAVAAERSGYASTGYVTSARLTLAKEHVTFRRGDSIRLRFVLLPWGTYRDKDDRNMRALRAEEEHRLAEASIGQAVHSEWIPTIRAEGEKAEFKLTGGKNNVAFAVEGFRSYRAPAVYKWQDDGWIKLNHAVNGYDGYRVYVDSQGTYGFTFVDATEGSSARYRVMRGEELK